MIYKPTPLDTDRIVLSDETLELVELLARNTHDLWARRRMAEGWSYGPHRDDSRKEHPCLVPYEDLPEGEKQYDRETAAGTLRAAMALGYSLHPPAASGMDREGGLQPPGAILQSCRAAAGESLRRGEPLVAYDAAARGLSLWPGDPRLRQLQALALARSGAVERGAELLEQLRRDGHADQETLGMLARTQKDLGLLAADPALRLAHLRDAAGSYLEAYRLTDGYWTGINAAGMALLTGQRTRAAELAGEVRASCQELLGERAVGDNDTYWVLATLGEAALILGELAESERWYRQASAAGRGRFGDLGTTRRNARLLADHLGIDRARIDRCFNLPRVVVFTGHMVDRPDRPIPRFPPSLEEAVRRSIHDRLARLNGSIGYASAACGSDLLFLESILELEGEAHVVLPFDGAQFVRESVDLRPGADWVARFDRVLQRAREVLVASERGVPGREAAYEYAALMQCGMASLRAHQLDSDLLLMAVWDGEPGDGPGGTAAVAERWRSLGHEVEVIDLAELRREQGPFPLLKTELARPEPAVQETPSPALATEIVAMLFADVVGFSKLSEEQIPRFARAVLGRVAELIAASPHQPSLKDSWGDGLYLVFSQVEDAGLFALELRDRLAGADWEREGLPKDLNLRIALHAGPAHLSVCPVAGKRTYLGTHVNRAARIEPVTPPGEVYASESFAALAAAHRVRGFCCSYVGQVPLAKGYGTFRLYHVARQDRRPLDRVEQ